MGSLETLCEYNVKPCGHSGRGRNCLGTKLVSIFGGLRTPEREGAKKRVWMEVPRSVPKPPLEPPGTFPGIGNLLGMAESDFG